MITPPIKLDRQKFLSRMPKTDQNSPKRKKAINYYKHHTQVMSAVKEQKLHDTSCTNCNKEFSPTAPERQPRLLSCGHSFCTDCVGRLPIQQRSIRSVLLDILSRASCTIPPPCSDHSRSLLRAYGLASPQPCTAICRSPADAPRAKF